MPLAATAAAHRFDETQCSSTVTYLPAVRWNFRPVLLAGYVQFRIQDNERHPIDHLSLSYSSNPVIDASIFHRIDRHPSAKDGISLGGLTPNFLLRRETTYPLVYRDKLIDSPPARMHACSIANAYIIRTSTTYDDGDDGDDDGDDESDVDDDDGDDDDDEPDVDDGH